MIVERTIFRMEPRSLRQALKRLSLPHHVKRDVAWLLEKYPVASAVVVAQRGPPGRIEIDPKQILLMFGGSTRQANKTRIGPEVGPSTTELYQTQRDAAIVELRQRGLLGKLAMEMAQDLRDDAEATLNIAYDAIAEIGLNRLDHQHIAEIVRKAVRDYEIDLMPDGTRPTP